MPRLPAGPGPYSFTNVHYYAAAASLFGTDVKGGYEYSGKSYKDQNMFPGHGVRFDTCTECHMGTRSFDAANKSHNVSKPNSANCECHFYDVPQVPGTFEFSNIRRGSIGNVDYDGDGNTTESLKSEIESLEAILYAQLRTYAANPAGINTSIAYDGAAYPYWFEDPNNNGIHDPGETTSFTQFDAALLKAAYNYQFSKKEPSGYIHNLVYIAQLLVDSYRDLGGDPNGNCTPLETTVIWTSTR